MIVFAGASPTLHANVVHRSAIGLSSQLRVFAVRRTGTCFDTAVLPACAGPERNVRADWIIVQGQGYLRNRAEQTVVPLAPGAVLTLSECHFEGARGVRHYDVHFHGEPFCAIELRYRVPTLPACPRVEFLGADPLALVGSLLDPMLDGEAATVRSRLPAVIDALDGQGLGPSRLHLRDLDLDPRLAQTMLATYNAFDLTSSLKTMAAAANLSLRQYTRLAKGAFHSLLLLPHDGFRATMSNLRIRVATCLLSHPDVGVGEVARAVGYSRPEAMDAAFRAAGLPSPSEVRRTLLDLHLACESQASAQVPFASKHATTKLAGHEGSVFERAQEDDGEEAADAARAVGDGALEVIRGERIEALALAGGDS